MKGNMKNKYTVKNNRTGETKTVAASTYRDALGKAFDVSATEIPRVLTAPEEVVFGSLQSIVGQKPNNYTVTKL
jgi:hypothetical protein